MLSWDQSDDLVTEVVDEDSGDAAALHFAEAKAISRVSSRHKMSVSPSKPEAMSQSGSGSASPTTYDASREDSFPDELAIRIDEVADASGNGVADSGSALGTPSTPGLATPFLDNYEAPPSRVYREDTIMKQPKTEGEGLLSEDELASLEVTASIGHGSAHNSPAFRSTNADDAVGDSTIRWTAPRISHSRSDVSYSTRTGKSVPARAEMSSSSTATRGSSGIISGRPSSTKSSTSSKSKQKRAGVSPSLGRHGDSIVRDNSDMDDGGVVHPEFKRIWIQSDLITPQKEEEEVRLVCRNLQKACLMRDKWVFKSDNGDMPLAIVKSDEMLLDPIKAKARRSIPPKDDRYHFEMKDGVFVVSLKSGYLLPGDEESGAEDDSLLDEDSSLTGTATATTTTSTAGLKRSSSTESNNSNSQSLRSTSISKSKSEKRRQRLEKKLRPFQPSSFEEFIRDLNFIMQELVMFGPAKTYCYQRLQILQAKFKLHVLLNEESEMIEVRQVPHRDIYNVRKIDNHVHHSACMTQKHLLRFIKSRLKHVGDEPVLKRKQDKKPVSLRHIFEEMNLTAYDLSIDALDMSAHGDTFHRFDRFNMKYNPLGQSSLRSVFLKYDNYIKGKFLADVTHEVFDDLEEGKYTFAEYRLSIYGKNPLEWNKLADWICDFDLKSPNVRWMIQIPRLYSVYKRNGLIKNFEEMIDNIFRPLFEVTMNPLSNAKLHLFLTLVVGFDSVDDESVREKKQFSSLDDSSPAKWNNEDNPPYFMWCYYLYANLYVLNKLRLSKGMNAFTFRPHAGEAGDVDHVASTFLLSESINHGLTLKKSPVLQYMYYLKQVGISMSPLSNNILFVAYDRNPFPQFFWRGLNVTLSTDDPLLIHYTKDALVEEYAIASQVYKLSAVDVCEIARNSVLQCGFPELEKRHWIGPKYHLRGANGNTIQQTNVPNIRLKFRDETLREEEALVMGLPLQQFPAGFTADYKVVRARSGSMKRLKGGSKSPGVRRGSLGAAALEASGRSIMRGSAVSSLDLFTTTSLKAKTSGNSLARKPSMLTQTMRNEDVDMSNVGEIGVIPEMSELKTGSTLPPELTELKYDDDKDNKQQSLDSDLSEDDESSDSIVGVASSAAEIGNENRKKKRRKRKGSGMKNGGGVYNEMVIKKPFFKVNRNDDGDVSLSVNFSRIFSSETLIVVSALLLGYSFANRKSLSENMMDWIKRFFPQ